GQPELIFIATGSEVELAVCRKRGTSVVAISHDEAFTRRHFSRRVLLEKGRVLRMV
ncbi:hypothetical protein V7P28_03015, partial [Klebsiella michiganensis]